MADIGTPATSQSARLRRRIESGDTIVVPGAANALTARLIEETGFEAVYVSGAGIANTFLGLPDIGLLSLPELASHVAAMRRIVDLPLIVDADTGFGNAVNVWRTVQVLEAAGANAIQIEDQQFPKKCGHFEGKLVVSASEMIEKLNAATEARRDPDLLIVARTDARATHGLKEACRRASLYFDAGADLVFLEAPESEGEFEYIANEVAAPTVLNLVSGGLTPMVPLAHLRELGFAIALYANLALQAGIYSMRNSLVHLHATGSDIEGPPHAPWHERQSLVRKEWFDDFAERVAATADSSNLIRAEG